MPPKNQNVLYVLVHTEKSYAFERILSRKTAPFPRAFRNKALTAAFSVALAGIPLYVGFVKYVGRRFATEFARDGRLVFFLGSLLVSVGSKKSAGVVRCRGGFARFPFGSELLLLWRRLRNAFARPPVSAEEFVAVRISRCFECALCILWTCPRL